MPNKKLPRPLGGVIVAAALLAAACGTETSTTVLDAAAADDNTAQAVQPAAEESAAAEETEGPVTEQDPAETEEETAQADVGNHLFPDLNTQNVNGGETLNLATELAGGDTPVLLWFYAPH